MTSPTKHSTPAAASCLTQQLLLLSLIALALLPTADAAYYSFSVGGIAGTAIGAIFFFGLVVFFIFFCCKRNRKRRMMAAQQRQAQVPVIFLGAPVSSVSGQVVAGHGSARLVRLYEPQPLGPGEIQHAPPPPYPMAPAGSWQLAGSSGYNSGYLPPPLPAGGAVNAGYYGDYSNLRQQQPSQAPPPYQPYAARF